MAGKVWRVLGRVVVVLAIVVGLGWPVVWSALELAAAEDITDPVSISDYQATYTVGSDGTLMATEQITATFPPGRHGIFRYWDVADPADSSVRYLPTVVSVTRDGAPERYDLSWRIGHRFLVARIGDPDSYLTSGSHTYAISYQIPGTISPAETSAAAPFATAVGNDAEPPGSAFLWSVVASGWEMDMAGAGATLALPEPSGIVQCATDPWGFPGPCEVSGAGTQTVRVSADPLPARTGMIVRATMQSDAPPRTHLPWPVTLDAVLGRTPWLTVCLALLAVAAGLTGWWIARTTDEQTPGFPVQYEPPRGLGPVQVVYVDTESAGPAPLIATVLHLAERGLVRLERPGETSWRVTNIATPTQWADVDPVSRAIADALGLAGPVPFDADGSVSAGKALTAADDKVATTLSEWSQQSGLILPDAREQGLKVLWFALTAVAILLFALPGILSAAGSLWLVPTLVGAIPAAFVLGGFSLTSNTVGQRRTQAGRLEWARAGGFRRLLSTPSSEERFDFAARTDVFLTYLPYAVAFGVADRWAEKYRTEMGTEPPIPIWYPIYMGHSMDGFYSGGDFDSFSKSVTASIGAYAAAQSASHGGGGGGGFGGGGGGGGGSW